MLAMAFLVLSAGPPVTNVQGKSLDGWLAAACASKDDARLEAIARLAEFGSQARRVVPVIGRLLDRSGERSAIQILDLLCDLGPDAAPAAPAVLRKLSRGTIREAEIAVHAVAAIGPGAKGAIPVLLAVYRDEARSSLMREVVPLAVASVEPRSAATRKFLLEAAKHEDAGVRVGAARAALRIGMDLPGRADLIRKAIKDKGFNRDRLVRLLDEMFAKGQDALPFLKALLDDESKYMRKDAFASICRHMPRTKALMKLCERMLSDKYSSIRYYAAQELGKFGPAAKPLVPKLLAALKDEDAFVRSEAGMALWRIDPRHERVAVDALIACLSADTPEARANAATLLGRIGRGAKRALPALRRALKEDSTDLRRSASAAIARIERLAKK